MGLGLVIVESGPPVPRKGHTKKEEEKKVSVRGASMHHPWTLQVAESQMPNSVETLMWVWPKYEHISVIRLIQFKKNI